MSEPLLVLDAGTLFTPDEKYSPGRVIVRGDRIEAAGALTDLQVPAEATRIDASGFTLVPGFIEPHVHGGGGFDVMEAAKDSMDVICRVLASHGTTSFLPTTVSAPVDKLAAAVERLANHIHPHSQGAQPLGIHLEGPFLNVAKRGTHRPENMLLPDAALLQKLIQKSRATIKLLTMAPELPGAAAVADLAERSGIVVGMGHSDASLPDARAAVDRGTRYAVHTFNAMRPLLHRDPGIAGAVLSDDRVFAEIIADGVHVSPEVVRIFARAKGRDRIILASDGISATGMPDGQYVLGTGTVRVTAGVCRDHEGRLAGSTLTQDKALRNLIDWAGMRLQDALFASTLNPARALSLNDRGQIQPGAFADLVLLDANLEVVQTFCAGRLVFSRSP